MTEYQEFPRMYYRRVKGELVSKVFDEAPTDSEWKETPPKKRGRPFGSTNKPEPQSEPEVEAEEEPEATEDDDS